MNNKNFSPTVPLVIDPGTIATMGYVIQMIKEHNESVDANTEAFNKHNSNADTHELAFNKHNADIPQ